MAKPSGTDQVRQDPGGPGGYPTSPDTTDTGAGDTGTTAPAKPTVQDLGNGYSLVSYTDDLGMPKSQIVPNKDAASVAAVEAAKIGAGAAGVSASITAGAANQRAAIQAEIDRAKNAADAAHNAAVLALQQGNAAEARRQFDISSQELARSHQADEALRQQSQHLEASKFGQSVYDKLSELASNPRNYMENFFRNRGQQPPGNVAQYGNTSISGPGLMTFEQFLPNFLKTLGLSPSGAAASSPTGGPASTPGPSAAAPTSGVSAGGGGLAGAPGTQQDLIKAALAGANASPATYASNKMTIPGTGPVVGGVAGANDTATVNGSRITGPGAGALAAGGWQPQPNLSDAAQTSVDLREDRNLKQYAGGGTLQMTAPHAIVNLLSGKVAAVAGEQPGRGPQGFVPEQAKFSGKAIIDPNKDSSIGLPPPEPPPDPFTPIPVEGFPNVFAGSTAPTPLGPDTSLRPTSPDFGPTPVSPSAAPRESTVPSITPTDQQGLIDATGAGVHPVEPLAGGSRGEAAPGGAGALPSAPPVGVFAPPVTYPNETTNITPGPAVGGTIGGSSNPPVGFPSETSGVPVAGNGAMPGVFNPPTFLTPRGTPNAWGGLTQTPSGIGNNPTFLPEDAAAKDPIIAAMLQSGAFPPFLQRVFAQQLGLAGLGTNVPQQTNLPAGVPLISQIALNQMSPSEFQAFQSYLSAHGIDWNDYIAMVREASPQGGSSNKNNPNIAFNPQFPSKF